MEENQSSDLEKLLFLYQRYQSRVDQLESWALKVTTGVLAISAGAILVSLRDFATTEADTNIMYYLYTWINVVFFTPLFLYATWYSLWTRYRVLYAVAKLVAIEKKLELHQDKLDYWIGKPWRARAFILTSPWPWILVIFSFGSYFSRQPLWGLTGFPACLALLAIYRLWFVQRVDDVSICK